MEQIDIKNHSYSTSLLSSNHPSCLSGAYKSEVLELIWDTTDYSELIVIPQVYYEYLTHAVAYQLIYAVGDNFFIS